MYLAHLLNSRGLFQRTGGWMLMPGAERRDKFFSALLQRATQMIYHLDRCMALRDHAIAQFSSYILQEPVLPASIRAWSPIISGLIAELSGALATIRIMQNDAWHLISAMSGARDAPSSISGAGEVFERASNGEHKLPIWLQAISNPEKEMILNYWRSGGSRLTDYRDIDQHFDVLARGAFFFPDRGGHCRLTVQLPDNPETKSPTQFTYLRGIDAIETIINGFTELHDLVERIAEGRGARPQRIGQSFEFRPAIEHQPGISILTAIMLYDIEGKVGIVLGQNERMQVTGRNIAPRGF